MPLKRLDDTRPARADLTGESDADLLLYMSMHEDAATARQAWGELYRRHAAYLQAVCIRACGPPLGGQADAADLVAETFKRAFEHAATFDPGPGADADGLRLRVRAWLGRIAQRLMQDALRGRARLPAASLDLQQWQQIGREPPADGPADGDQPQPDGQAVLLAREAIEALSEAEQTVLRVTFQYYRPDAPHQRLPNEVCRDLAATLRTTPENLRQIRRRALRKIANHLRAGQVQPGAGRDEQRQR